MILGAILVPRTTNADEFSDFEAARNAYDQQDYTRAAALFEAMVGGEVPAIQNDLLIKESRKYWGAALLFLGRRSEADQAFEELLRSDLSYELDPLAFSEEVQQVFLAVKVRLAEQARLAVEAEHEREAEQRRREAERLMREQERFAILTDLASEETVEVRRSRWIAALPFGVGQFQNDHRVLGWVLGVGQALLAAGSIATGVAHSHLGSRDPDRTDRAKFEQVERALRLSNWSLVGAFGAVAIGGIIDAQIRFTPVRRTTRRRELPPAVEGSIGPGAVSVSVRF